jgi:ribosome maturation factor RimP
VRRTVAHHRGRRAIRGTRTDPGEAEVGGHAHFLFPRSHDHDDDEEVHVSDRDDALRDTVTSLARPLAEARGLALVSVEVKGTGGRGLVRVRVDRKGGVGVADCQELSRELSDALDEADPIEDRYALEVTSPGVDHPLTDRAAFDRVEGRPVLVHRGGDGAPREVRGTVRAAEEDAVVLDVDGTEVRIPYGDIAKATQALPW